MSPMHPRGRRYWINLFAFALLLVCLLAAGGVLWLSRARTMAYIQPPRQRASAQLLDQHDITYQQVFLYARDGVRLSAWYTLPCNGIVILVAHGHGGTIPVEYYLMFAERGYGVLAWDFRAHGESSGAFSTMGYNESLDVKAALDFALLQTGVKHIGAWGGSMGAAALLHAAARYPEIEAVVADSSYATLKEVADMRSASTLLRPFVRLFGWMETGVDLNQMRPVEDVARLSPRAVFIIQGLADTAIPADSAQRLYEAAGEPRELWVEPGIPHLGMYPQEGAEYVRRVMGFFERMLGTPNSPFFQPACFSTSP